MTVQADDLAHCFDLIKQHVPDFYLADLLLPDACREAAVILHAFHVEATNVALIAREPMAGEVRLQWWMDVLDGQRTEEAQGHPVARALLSAIEHYDLSPASLDAKLKAHVFDLYSDPMADRTMLEGYLGETYSVLFQNILLAHKVESSSETADASGHTGVALGLVSLLQNLARHRSEHRAYVPQDLLKALGTDVETYLSNDFAANKSLAGSVVEALIDLAQEHEGKARAAVNKLPKGARPIFKPLSLVRLYLKQAKNSPELALQGYPSLPQLKKQWVLWRF